MCWGDGPHIDHIHIGVLGKGFVTGVGLWNVKPLGEFLGTLQGSGGTGHHFVVVAKWFGRERGGEILRDDATRSDAPTSCHCCLKVDDLISSDADDLHILVVL